MNLFKILCFFGWHYHKEDLETTRGRGAWWKCMDCGHEDTDWY